MFQYQASYQIMFWEYKAVGLISTKIFRTDVHFLLTIHTIELAGFVYSQDLKNIHQILSTSYLSTMKYNYLVINKLIMQLSLAEEPVCHCGLVLYTIMAIVSNLITQKKWCAFTTSDSVIMHKKRLMVRWWQFAYINLEWTLSIKQVCFAMDGVQITSQ